MPLPNRGSARNVCATSAANSVEARRTCPPACSQVDLHALVRTGASSDAQRQQNATERLGVYVSVERYLTLFGRLISIAPRLSPSASRTSRFAKRHRNAAGAEAASNSSSFTRDSGRSGPSPVERPRQASPLAVLAPPIAPPLARAPYPLENEIGVQLCADARPPPPRRQGARALLDDPLGARRGFSFAAAPQLRLMLPPSGVHLGSRWTPNPIQMRADRRPSDHAYTSAISANQANWPGVVSMNSNPGASVGI